MATNSQTFYLTWAQTNQLQPDKVSPPTLPTYADTTPIQQVDYEFVLPASTSTSIALPPGWSQITQAKLINTDLTSYLNVKFGASNLAVTLGPNGGSFDSTLAFNTSSGVSTSYTAIPLLSGQSAFPQASSWVLTPVTISGAAAAANTCNCYLWLTGF